VRPETGILNKKEAKQIKTADQVSADDRMVLARALCSWSGSDRHAIEIPNHQGHFSRSTLSFRRLWRRQRAAGDKIQSFI